MSLLLRDITKKCVVMALFIRDDGQRFLLGDGDYEFNEGQLMFEPNELSNDIVELQGTDGVIITGQARRTSTQEFRGYIGDATTTPAVINTKRFELIKFFKIDHKYDVVYITNLTYKPANTTYPLCLIRHGGFLVEEPTSRLLRFGGAEYRVTMSFENPDYEYYAEDALGARRYILQYNFPSNSVNPLEREFQFYDSARDYSPIIIVTPNNSSYSTYGTYALSRLGIGWTDRDGNTRSLQMSSQPYLGNALEAYYTIDCINKTVVMTNKDGISFSYTNYFEGEFPEFQLNPNLSTQYMTLTINTMRANYTNVDYTLTVKANPLWQ